DLYSIKPVDSVTLRKAARQTGRLLVVEDHRPAGGIGEAVRAALGSLAGTVISLAVNKTPRSGKPAELIRHQGIDSSAIVQTVNKFL
ncbi:MAG: transketolase, partial [Candidatus Kerfeldbacteria bacterium]|nr:transketolase [Candidatus Kerfeldbacteria bacterium]